MRPTLDQLDRWMMDYEGETLEFKEAKTQYDSSKLVRYCAALANEGGGHLILGVTDKKPRQVVGTRAFQNIEKKKHELLQKLGLRVDVDEIMHPDGRVIVFTIPSRPIGVPVKADGDYVMRSGESLVSMTPEKLRAIFDETGPDFSAEICSGANLTHLDPRAIEAFRSAWIAKSGNAGLAGISHEQLLEDAELILDGGATYAALAMLGDHRSLGRFLADAEVVFEWRLKDGSTRYDQRREFRVGFFLSFDALWKEIDSRNQVYQYQSGLFRWDIPTFRETVIRESILNAVAHRDYRVAGSIFIKQSPTMLEVSSPGGFPEGITPENIVWKQKPRNRRIAETLARCGFVERSGQGVNLMFEWAVRDAKQLPDYSRSDRHEVIVRLDGQVKDARFLRFLELLGVENQAISGVEDLIVLSYIRDGASVPDSLKARIGVLTEMGAIEPAARGRHILSRRFYEMVGRKGEYTRKRGLDRDTNKALLLKHIERNRRTGSTASEFQQVLPNLTRHQIYSLVKELRHDGKISKRGDKRGTKWFPQEPNGRVKS